MKHKESSREWFTRGGEVDLEGRLIERGLFEIRQQEALYLFDQLAILD